MKLEHMDRVTNDNYSHSDSSSAAQYSQPHHQEIRAAPPTSYSSGTPNSEYPSATPSSARSSTFPQDYLSRQHYTPGSASMAQTQNPSIAAASPTYPPPYSPYGGPQSHPMAQHTENYPPSYPPWPGYGAHPHMSYHSPPSSSPSTTRPPGPGQQVYSFVPIPGSQQTKRPRRRYEEIERMYKCGHQNCEKAYGTLNHLNAHVTMQQHGPKRTPEEFKEIRKEWKQRKKEDEASRKVDGDRGRVDSGPEAQLAGATSSPDSTHTPTSQTYATRPQLPPLPYTNGNGNGSYSGPEPVYQQNGQSQMYSTYPHQPYSNSPGVYARQ